MNQQRIAANIADLTRYEAPPMGDGRMGESMSEHTSRPVCGCTPTRPTRYAALGYRQDSSGIWRIVAVEGDASVGPYYRTKFELLADLDRYAREYGAA